MKDFLSINNNYTFEELSKVIKPISGITLAHKLAKKGAIFTDFEILSLKDKNGNTVAHYMALNGYIFKDPRILELKNNEGYTVEYYVCRKKKKKFFK